MSASKFLHSVLGEDGAGALIKAAKRAPILETVLVPRTVVAWLTTSIRLGYEGQIPGLENSYIQVSKAEDQDSFNGAMTLGEHVHSFEAVSLLYLAAAVGVALGVDGQKLDPMLKGQDLSKLGKTIDLLVNAKLIAKSLAEEPVEKAISSLAPGQQIGHNGKNPVFNYDHLLSPAHRLAGYSLRIEQKPDGMQSQLHHGQVGPNSQIGRLEVDHDRDDKSISMDVADLDEAHRGRGLGSAMYEAAMTHGKHNFGAEHVKGSVHSSMASKVHERLSVKHGMGYRPMDTPFPHLASATPGPFDARHGPYDYALKEELPETTKSERSVKREVNVSAQEALRKCGECGGRQFNQHKFVGCLCFRGLAKSVTSTQSDGRFVVKFNGMDWDDDSITAIISILKG